MKLLLLLVLASALQGCSVFNPHGTLGEEGQFWCNERYRADGAKIWDSATEAAAQNGYIYGLAAALALQSDDPRDQEAQAHWFSMPLRLEVVDRPQRSKSGFEVITFRLKPLSTDKSEEIIIAFAGSNDRSDWISTNLNPFGREQYDEAVSYTKRILFDPRVTGRKVVLAGISLGGGLAIHVLKDSEVEPFIAQAWVLNPSPKIYSPEPATERMKSKTWMGYSDGEILTWARSDFVRAFIAGAGEIEPGENQTAVFKLIKSNRIYAHFRWGIARQMLWIADYEETRSDRSKWTEPFAILQDSRFRACLEERSKYSIKKELQPKGARPDYSGVEIEPLPLK